MKAATQRATKDLALDSSDLARWEGEGGAARQGQAGNTASKRPAVHTAMSARPSYDSPHRSAVEVMVSAMTTRAARVVAGQGPLSSNNEERGKVRSSPRDAPAKANKRRGRRTMSRHGNRP